MSYLINIDNGGTLTDICVADGDTIFYTKTLTTPADLSDCFFTGISKIAEEISGTDNLPEFLRRTDLIRYSSTQGTNALVERKGPSIGLITDETGLPDRLRFDDNTTDLFNDLIGSRVVDIGTADPGDRDREAALVRAINTLITAGAERLVVSMADADRERTLKRIFLARFPRHLLGSVPVLFAREFSDDRTEVRRVWSAVLNSFLHPTLERFLYSAEHRLRAHKIKKPLLIYRNDGASSRVAKSVALKTYSSGPRGGLEGARSLAETYGLPHVLMIDVGGTTTDVGEVDDLRISADRRGRVENVPTSIELSDVRSAGVGGSSVIRAVDGRITVGPDSVGAAPGPACFGFGGTEATITDVNLLLGVLDPETYLNGELRLDPERSRQAVLRNVAEPLGITLEEALTRMEKAHASRIADAFRPQVRSDGDTTLAVFGGGGPMSACLAARLAGVRQVIIPRLAAVFSAYGISFSDIAQDFEVEITGKTDAQVNTDRQELLEQAERYMFQEGHDLDECETEWTVIHENSDGSEHHRSRPGDTGGADSGTDSGTDGGTDSGLHRILRLTARHILPHPAVKHSVSTSACAPHPAGTRTLLTVGEAGSGTTSVPVLVLEDQPAGASGEGPAIVEGPFFTARVPGGWDFTVSDAGDLILNDRQERKN
ncbi:hydantoinase/oxoprolinase family protein [uncultured Corynebacterium sp.]|uniref:hydantoinase/oxoprolinase family protein n=1 Tax=uncultured Corynebacterium sp. TaxID=159447 RepID=UPI0025DC9174|nr:hydantoinase/oxoprolinase family protein [uncultured Corynebacterium sp.]